MDSVDGFNRLPGDAARRELARCCSSARWIDGVAAGRPYPDLGSLLAASDAAVAALSQADLAEALAGHPRIGERKVLAGGGNGAAHGWPGREQAGVASAGEQTLAALDAGNAEYERRFGHIYLACATGRSAGELLAFLRERLGNDSETEWGVVAGELAKINQIRLTKLIGAGT